MSKNSKLRKKILQKKPKEDLKRFVERYAADMFIKIHKDLAVTNLNQFTPLMTRIAALEELVMEKFGIQAQELIERNLVIEERANKLKAIEGPAEKGDTVLIQLQYLQDGEEVEEKLKILELAVEKNGTTQVDPVVENAIIGHKVGEVVKIGKKGQMGEIIHSLTVDRISRKEPKND